MDKWKLVKQFIRFIFEKKKYWLIPILISLIIVGVLIVLGEGSPVAPFIYSLF